jgi:hypothetical protein
LVEGYAITSADGYFARSRERFEAIVADLSAPETRESTHAELEEQIGCVGRELMRSLLQDHLDLRAAREEQHPVVTGADGIERRSVERGHVRALATVFGQVSVERLAYRRKGARNLYPTDETLNLPAELHSHGLRKLAAVEAARGSFAAAGEAIGRVTGTPMGTRQVEQLARAAAVDVDAFYQQRRPGPSPATDLLVLTMDGKGVVMRPEALREPVRTKAASRKLSTRLSRGEKRNRKRMAEVGAVYDATPAVRTPDDIIAPAGRGERHEGPKARDKWLTASVTADATEVISSVFDEAERRDPEHTRRWVALVDGNSNQIDAIGAETIRRKIPVPIVIDFVHVLEYVWAAAWCFFSEGDPAAETWVAGQARRILHGKAATVATAIRRKAIHAGLSPGKRVGVDKCVGYLRANRRYLRYDRALAFGWPIATGVVEGACRHLVKDRMDITGARWGLGGAEAILKLRSVIANGDFEEYWRFHVEREQHRIHHARYRYQLAA